MLGEVIGVKGIFLAFGAFYSLVCEICSSVLLKVELESWEDSFKDVFTIVKLNSSSELIGKRFRSRTNYIAKFGSINGR